MYGLGNFYDRSKFLLRGCISKHGVLKRLRNSRVYLAYIYIFLIKTLDFFFFFFLFFFFFFFTLNPRISPYFTVVLFVFSGPSYSRSPSQTFEMFYVRVEESLAQKTSIIRARIYSRTSMARTPMARLPWLIRTRF